jgi:thymidylate synthase
LLSGPEKAGVRGSISDDSRARCSSVRAEIGRYKHFFGSLHLYDQHHEKAKNFIDEGWQSKTSMPIMPLGDQRPNLQVLLRLEEGIRKGLDPAIPDTLPEYWRDLAYLLKIYRADQDEAPNLTVSTRSAIPAQRARLASNVRLKWNVLGKSASAMY